MIYKIFDRWQHLMTEHPEYRVGQALYNAINQVDPAMAVTVRLSNDLNPYYVDTRVSACIGFIYEEVQRREGLEGNWTS